MSVRSETIEYAVVDCDGCSKTFGDDFDDYDEDEAVAAAERNGWSSLTDDIHLCQDCAAEPAKQAKVAGKYKEETGEDLPEPTPIEQAILMHGLKLAVSA